MKKVVVAKSAGFCFGVSRSVRMAEEMLETGPCLSLAGGGALPEEEIGSFALCVRPGKITGKSAGQITGKNAGQISAAELQRRLRTLPVPVLGRIVRDRFLVDMRTVSDTDREYLAELFSGEELFSPGTFQAPDGMEQKAEPEKGSGL